MSQRPEVSVLMSVRNGMPFVQQTIQSLIDQSFTNWEFVIVDNASTDETLEILESAAANEPRIHLIASAADLGHSGGLNRGLAECRGVWIARIDADDLALPNRLERQLAFLQANPDIHVTSCLGDYINARGQVVGNITNDLTTREVFQHYVRRNLAIGILHPGAVIRRDLLQQVGGYRGAFDPANDTDLWGRLVDAGALILVQQEPLMKYRVHERSISAQSFCRNRLKYQWARDCMRSRRRGETEATWNEYVGTRENAPFRKRANRWRKTNARRFYRQAAQHFISGQVMQALVELTVAIFLQPSYAAPRLVKQRLVKERASIGSRPENPTDRRTQSARSSPF
jgi:glycosyltransferase involved in cell wall biosynthesis